MKATLGLTGLHSQQMVFIYKLCTLPLSNVNLQHKHIII